MKTKLNDLQDRIQDALAEMSPRDRKFLAGMVAGVAFLIIFGGGFWMNSSLAHLNGLADDRQEKLRLVQTLTVDHAAAIEQANAIEEQLRAHAGTDLSAFLEQSADKTGIRDRLDSVREKSTSNDGIIEDKLYSVSLSKVGLEEFSNFLYEVETSGFPMRIRSVKAKSKKTRDESILNITMDISAHRVLTAPEGE